MKKIIPLFTVIVFLIFSDSLIHAYNSEYNSAIGSVIQYYIKHETQIDDDEAENFEDKYLEYLETNNIACYYTIVNIEERGKPVLLVVPLDALPEQDSTLGYEVLDSSNIYSNQCEVYYYIDGEVTYLSALESLGARLSLYEKEGKYYIGTSHNAHSKYFNCVIEDEIYTYGYYHNTAVVDSVQYSDAREDHSFSGDEYLDAIDDYSEVGNIAFTITNAVVAISEYIIEGSDSRYITKADLVKLTPQQVYYARNEIYARKGRKFNSRELQEYFATKDWYTPIYEPEYFSVNIAKLCNDYEIKNGETISKYEETIDRYVLDLPGYDIHAVDIVVKEYAH